MGIWQNRDLVNEYWFFFFPSLRRKYWILVNSLSKEKKTTHTTAWKFLMLHFGCKNLTLWEREREIALYSYFILSLIILSYSI